MVRVKVENNCLGARKGCRAYLVNNERQGPSGKFEPTAYCESMQLAWASQADQSFSAFDLPRGVPQFIDIMSTRPTSPAFQLAIKVIPLRYAKLVLTPGVYRFTLSCQATASNPLLFAQQFVGLAFGTRPQRWIRSIESGQTDADQPITLKITAVQSMARDLFAFRSGRILALVTNGEVRANAYLLPIALGQTCFRRYCTAFSFW